MTGVICIDKPQDFTSFDTVAVLRRCFHTKKIGHGGTLDPMATGVLPVFVGGATKAAGILPDTCKGYRAGFRLGLTSDTLDIWGELTEHPFSPVSGDTVLAALDNFRGDIMQTPPMYSALKVNGQKLCDLARRGIEVERAPRPVTVSLLELTGFDGRDGVLEVECSSGTYIRSLIDDIGSALGCGAVMTSLCRTRGCGFELSQCHTLDEVRGASESQLSEWLLPVESVFTCYPVIELDAVQSRMYLNGVRLDADRLESSPPVGTYRVYANGVFAGIADISADRELISVKRFQND